MGPKKKSKKSGSPEAKKKNLLAQAQKEKEEEDKRLEEEEKLIAQEAAKIFFREQARRNKLLKSSCNNFRELMEFVESLAWEKRNKMEWECYINCKNLPIASDIPMINTYLFMLKNKKILWKVENCFNMCPKLLAIIEMLDDYIDNPLGASYRRIENWKEVRNDYRDVIAEGIDMMCYLLLRDLNKNLTAIDLWTYELRKSCDNFFLGLWVFGEYPKLKGYPEHNYDNIGVSVTLPKQYRKQPVVMRVMKMKYNHFNDRCITNTCPVLPDEYNTNFYTSVTEWFVERMRYMDITNMKKVNSELDPWVDGMFFRDIIYNGAASYTPKAYTSIYNLQNDKIVPGTRTEDSGSYENDLEFTMKNNLYLDAEETITTIPVPIGQIIDRVRTKNEVDFVINCEEREGNMKTIDELIQEHMNTAGISTKGKGLEKPKSERDEDRAKVNQLLEDIDTKYTENILWKRLETEVDPGEINLRRHNVIGNLFSVELFHLPQQEMLLNDASKLRTIRGKKAIEKIDFNEKYEPPAIVEERSEDDEGKERKKESGGINKLLGVTLTLEENCLWFEPPALVQWDYDRECWTDEFIVEAKYNEEKQNFTFRSGRMGIFGFMVQRYSNLPYQTWDLRPESHDTVLFNITASTVVVDFRIKQDKVCIIQIQNAPTSVLDHLLNVYFDPPILIKKMKRFGLDLFPDYDTFHYVEGSTYKDILLENHTYACMGIFSTAYNFTWSRWNSFLGRNKIVFQLRESLEKNSSANFQMFLGSTERALFVDCTEVSPVFFEKGIPGMDFYPDLYSVICFHSTDAAKKIIKSTHPYLVQTVFTMLKSTRVFTFS